jgi:uracil-DNA glycosylase family 4
VRCVPPENKPLPEEVRTCRKFLEATIAEMARLRAILALGRIAHESVARAFDVRPSALPFAHGARHSVGHVELFDSYHCSRQNTNTGTLTPDMFRAVFAAIRAYLDEAAA